MLSAIIIAHLAVALCAPSVATRIGARGYLVMALVPALAFGWLLTLAPLVASGGSYVESVEWIGRLGVVIDYRIGMLQWVLALIVTGVGALVLVYCRWYFADGDPPAARPGRADRLRRRDARAGHGRRPDPALRLLGADHGLLLPADRPQPDPQGQPAGGAAGADRHHRRRPGDAGRHRDAGRAGRHVPALRRCSPTRRTGPAATRGRGAAAPGRRASASRRWSRSTSGCPGRWPRRPRSAPTCTPRRW